jgi:hypothetical protein
MNRTSAEAFEPKAVGAEARVPRRYQMGEAKLVHPDCDHAIGLPNYQG